MPPPPSGYGLGGFGVCPFGVPYPAPAEEPRVVLRSSRDVDMIRGGYAVDADGNFVGMDDVAQRVLLAVRTAKIPELQILGFDEEARAEIRRVLDAASLTTGATPAITLFREDPGETIEIRRDPGGARIAVFYKNNLTGTKTSVEVP